MVVIVRDNICSRGEMPKVANVIFQAYTESAGTPRHKSESKCSVCVLCCVSILTNQISSRMPYSSGREVTSVTTLSDLYCCVPIVTMPPSGTPVSHINCKRKCTSQTDYFGGI